jgi:hypothetical protein
LNQRGRSKETIKKDKTPMYVYGPFENNQLKCVNVHSENGFYIDPIGYFGAICIIAV